MDGDRGFCCASEEMRLETSSGRMDGGWRQRILLCIGRNGIGDGQRAADSRSSWAENLFKAVERVYMRGRRVLHGEDHELKEQNR